VVYGKEITELVFTERKLRYRIPLDLGQKTGFYFDQRPLRARVEALAKGAKVLDSYAYACSFGMAASRGGAAEVTSVDENALALEVGAACARDNGLEGPMTFLPKDARKVLQEAKGAYDLVICDPPRLAPTRSAREQALVHYAKLAELSCRATKPGGLVVVCSCSAAVDLTALTRALGTGALRANVRATVLERHFQGADHPVSAAFGEGLYLKALIALVEPR
jgi:23S rRNA (cytosine1962-C5)-methyltransferase